MTRKPVARVGDTGSHGGAIISGSAKIKANDLSVALVGADWVADFIYEN